MKLNKIFEGIPFVIISTLFSGFFVGFVIYWMQKADNNRTWCMQEVKQFNINNYNKKDLSILVYECKDEIKQYNLLEDILFNSDDTDKFSSIINQLYVDNNIDNEFIINFSDNSLLKNIKNPNYNFDNTLVNTRNNLPLLDKQITKYLKYTKEILFNEYSDDQQSNYFRLFIRLFTEDILIKDESLNSVNIFFPIDNHSIDPIIDTKLLDLQKISENIGKVDKRVFFVDSKDVFILSLNELYNSYRHKNQKNHLIERMSVLSDIILKFIQMDRSKFTKNNQCAYIGVFGQRCRSSTGHFCNEIF